MGYSGRMWYISHWQWDISFIWDTLKIGDEPASHIGKWWKCCSKFVVLDKLQKPHVEGELWWFWRAKGQGLTEVWFLVVLTFCRLHSYSTCLSHEQKMMGIFSPHIVYNVANPRINHPWYHHNCDIIPTWYAYYWLIDDDIQSICPGVPLFYLF